MTSAGTELNEGKQAVQSKRKAAIQVEGKGFWIRAGSFLIDMFVFSIFVQLASTTVVDSISGFIAARGVELTDTLEIRLFLASRFSWLAFWLAYFVVFEWLFGATPAKAAFRMRIVRLDGNPCTLGAALIRGLIRFVEYLSLGIIAALNMRRPLNQRWGDKLARTVVIASHDVTPTAVREWGRFALAVVVTWVFGAVLLGGAMLWAAW